MTVNSIAAAWNVASNLISGDYSKDDASSQWAGYPIFRNADRTEYICDLGDRLEVNKADGSSIDIWIVEIQEPVTNVENASHQTSNLMTYSVREVLECRDRVNNFDWSTDKKSQYTWDRYRTLRELFEFCYAKTGSIGFAEGWNPFDNFSKIMSQKTTKKELDKAFKACERFLKWELVDIWRMMQAGEVNVTS